MIVVVTGMDKMPVNCCECTKRIELSAVDGTYCNIADRRYTHRIGRPDWCPLVEIKTAQEANDGNERANPGA